MLWSILLSGIYDHTPGFYQFLTLKKLLYQRKNQQDGLVKICQQNAEAIQRFQDHSFYRKREIRKKLDLVSDDECIIEFLKLPTP